MSNGVDADQLARRLYKAFNDPGFLGLGGTDEEEVLRVLQIARDNGLMSEVKVFYSTNYPDEPGLEDELHDELSGKDRRTAMRLYQEGLEGPPKRARAARPLRVVVDGTLAPMPHDERAPGPMITFDEALKEGASRVGSPNGMEFSGIVTGDSVGADAQDRYDARDWQESGAGHLVLKPGIDAWTAFKNLVENVGKPIQKSTSPQETTKWAFDCAGFVVVNRIYAYYRTLWKSEFNKKFQGGDFETLDIGTNSSIWRDFERTTIGTDRPLDRPTLYQRPDDTGYEYTASELEGQETMHQLVDEAPIGSHIRWGNVDAFSRCNNETTKNAYDFCVYQYENTTKIGPNQYSAHPMGPKSREEIENAMAMAVINELIQLGKLSRDTPVKDSNYVGRYIKKNIYIKSIMAPKGKNFFDRFVK